MVAPLSVGICSSVLEGPGFVASPSVLGGLGAQRPNWSISARLLLSVLLKFRWRKLFARAALQACDVRPARGKGGSAFPDPFLVVVTQVGYITRVVVPLGEADNLVGAGSVCQR